MIYLASPYSHIDPAIVWSRFRAAEAATAWLLERKYWCYSPIVHCHALAETHRLPTDHAYWLEYNFHMLDRADHFYVLHIPGWRESKGISAEFEYWVSLGNHGLTWLHPHHELGYVKTGIEGCAPGAVLSGLDQGLHAMDETLRKP